MQLDKDINPFINSLRVPYIEFVTDRKFNEVKSDIESYGYEVEADKHCRVYSSVPIKVFLFQTLTMYARDLLLAIQHFTNTDYLYVIVSFDKIKELFGSQKVSKRRYEDTMRELIRNSVIDYKDKSHNQYWYNPMYFAPGSRLTLFKECKIKIKTEKVGQKLLKGT